MSRIMLFLGNKHFHVPFLSITSLEIIDITKIEAWIKLGVEIVIAGISIYKLLNNKKK